MKRIAAILSLLAASALAQTIDQRIDRDLPQLLETYRNFHAHPELSTQEKVTSSIFANRLRELGYEVTERVGKYPDPNQTCYGVVAVMKNGDGPVVLVRTDMDALPIVEQTGLAFASTVRAKNATGDDVGVMHACGHDLHMTSLLGTAKMLAEMKSSWRGTVMIVGQPAEEIVAGALAMLRDDLYTRFPRPTYVLAIHDAAHVPAGKVGYTPGYTMASSDSVDVTIRGLGGHGAAPDKGKDPVVVAAEFIVALQTIVSRERPPLDPVVVTVGSIHGGTKRNIIPDEVKLLLTVRTYKPEIRQKVLASIERIAKGIALAAGIPDDRAPIVTQITSESTEATYNDPEMTQRLATTLKRDLGESNVIQIDPLMVSEDFGRFGLDRRIPAVMLHLGAADPARLAAGNQPGLHSSGFAPVADVALRTGIRVTTACVIELLKK